MSQPLPTRAETLARLDAFTPRMAATTPRGAITTWNRAGIRAYRACRPGSALPALLLITTEDGYPEDFGLSAHYADSRIMPMWVCKPLFPERRAAKEVA